MLSGAEKTKQNSAGTSVTLFTPSKADKKSDSILDIPKIPFNVNRYQQALTRGYCQTREYKTHIDLERLHAPCNKPGSGFGMAKFREIVKKSMDLNCPGKVMTDASTSYGSPHLFYLYMGMGPETYSAHYLWKQYGMIGERVYDKLNSLSKYEVWTAEILQKECDQYMLDKLKMILEMELNINDKNKLISLDGIIANKELLMNLRDKKIDYVSEIFLPSLLKILARDPKDKFPNTGELGAMHMHLTDQGFARWKYVIENGFEFVPFKNLEHLNLNADQKALLQDIQVKRAAVAVNPALGK